MDTINTNKPINPSEIPVQPTPNQVNNPRSIFPIILGIIFILLIGIGGYSYLMQHNLHVQQNSQNTVAPSPTSTQSQSGQPKEIRRAFTTVTGEGILITSQYEIWKVNPVTGKIELLYKNTSSSNADESTSVDDIKGSPDGKKLAIKVSRNTNRVNGVITANLELIDLASKTVEQVDMATFQGEVPFGGASTLLDYNWSPNSQDLAYVMYKDSTSSTAKVYNLNNKTKTELGVASSPIWINNNKDVIFSNKNGVVKINADTKAKSNTTIKLRQFPAVPPGEFQSAPALVPNSTNTVFLAVSENNEMYQLAVDTMTLKPLGTNSEVIHKAGWSPNDKNIAVILRKNDKPALAILTSSETLSQAKTLDTDLGELVDHAYGITDDFVWSPDSSYIQFATRVYNLASSSQVKGITMEFCPGGGPHPASREVIWSKSSQEVAYYPCSRTGTDNWMIYTLDNGTKKVLEGWQVFGNLTGDKWFAYKSIGGDVAILDNNGQPLK